MPELDFIALCDYARTDNGVIHMIAGGIDRLNPPQLPFVHNLGIAARFALEREECGRLHEVNIVIKAPNGETVVALEGQLNVEYPANQVEGWPAYFSLTPNFPVPLQTAGLHSVEVSINKQHVKTLRILVEPRQGA